MDRKKKHEGMFSKKEKGGKQKQCRMDEKDRQRGMDLKKKRNEGTRRRKMLE